MRLNARAGQARSVHVARGNDETGDEHDGTTNNDES